MCRGGAWKRSRCCYVTNEHAERLHISGTVCHQGKTAGTASLQLNVLLLHVKTRLDKCWRKTSQWGGKVLPNPARTPWNQRTGDWRVWMFEHYYSNTLNRTDWWQKQVLQVSAEIVCVSSGLLWKGGSTGPSAPAASGQRLRFQFQNKSTAGRKSRCRDGVCVCLFHLIISCTRVTNAVVVEVFVCKGK